MKKTAPSVQINACRKHPCLCRKHFYQCKTPLSIQKTPLSMQDIPIYAKNNSNNNKHLHPGGKHFQQTKTAQKTPLQVQNTPVYAENTLIDAGHTHSCTEKQDKNQEDKPPPSRRKTPPSVQTKAAEWFLHGVLLTCGVWGRFSACEGGTTLAHEDPTFWRDAKSTP